MTRAIGAGLMLAALGIFGAVLAQEPSFPVPQPPQPAQPSPAAGPPGGVLYTKLRQFRVPVILGAKPEQISQLQLYVSTDNGRTWAYSSSTTPDLAKPEQVFFRFNADRDGSYWFAVQSFDKKNRAFPQNMDNAEAMLKVTVDTTPPQISVQALAPRGNEVGVNWIIRDESVNANDKDAVRLDFRSLNAGASWVPLIIPAGATQFYWNPNLVGPIEVRVQARDRADNLGEGFTRLTAESPASNFTPANPNTNPTPNPNPAYTRNYETSILNPPAPSEIKLINSKRVNLGYDVKDVGPSGVPQIDLFLTADGRSWQKTPTAPDVERKNITFEVDREGLYGMTLVAKSGVGLGERPPQAGDRPQAWIEVDLTKPSVALRDVKVGQGIDKGKLKVSWVASDKNLGSACITLKYAENNSGPWQVMAEKINNVGDYVWLMPAQLPYQFFVKVEAIDRAGNLGEDATAQAVKVDLSIPKAIPLTITPAN